VADVPEGAGVSTRANEQQRAAIEATGDVFVAAGAGTGKTAVLVERFVRAVVDEGIDVDSMLVITYTERAAGELRARIRSRLLERGRADLALELDNAWVSTIHGFCRRLLGAYPLAAGVDPGFRVLDEPQALVLQAEAFTVALERFCAADEPDRWQLLATYGAVGLRHMLVEVYATLRSAGRELVLEPGARAPMSERVDALREAAQCLLDDAAATEAQHSAAAAALELIESTALPERLLSLSEVKTRGPRAAAFAEARDAVVAAALEDLAARDRALLQELLTTFAATYADAKRRESALDFEDLQLEARDLLRDDPVIRERERLRFRAVMVDEFQDTNRLQTELLDLLCDGAESDLFVVGDEFQSIYGFRHADVAVFRERRAVAPTVLPLTLNHRSRPEVLSAVNELFGAEFGDEFRPLDPADGSVSPLRNAFELLVTDKAAAAETGVHWRRSEARHVARRVRELVDAGDATPGEIVLLFAAGTDAEWFEEELRAVGLPTYRAAGRNYFGQQQVADLLAYLRLLQNRYDDEALLTVLTSPFVGVSNDALVLIRAEAQRQPIFRGLERALPGDLAETDRRLVMAFRQRYDRLLELAAHAPLELLCERVLAEHDYDLAVLARHDGRRRYANLRKLARLARSYEELRGNDLEGFIRFVEGQEAVGAKESDAVSEEEGADAVRLLTIHAAKGLEFKVVVVADAGRSRPPVSDILALSDGRFGFKVAHPATGTRVSTASYRDVKEELEHAERAERLRLYYVAMTRAMERLLVSGSIGSGREESEETPIGWVLDRLGLEDEARSHDGESPVEVERGGATVLLRVDRGQVEGPPAPARPEAEPVLASENGQLALFEGSGESLPPPAPRLHELTAVPEPPLHAITRLSFSALSLFERCSYRYYAERVAGMRPVDWGRDGDGTAGALHPTEIGDAVHRLLELVDLAQPAVPDDLGVVVRGWYPTITDGEVEHVAAHVRAYCDSSLARRVAGLGDVRVERPFAFLLDGVLLNGRLDVLARSGAAALVLDYKTNALDGREPAAIVEADYRLQQIVYALACFAAGAEEVEVVYQFLEAPEEVVSAIFARTEIESLEHEVARAIARIREGDFRPTPSSFACSGCPALDRVCAGPRLGGAPDGAAAQELTAAG
jgi:ATP-dependent exoDNAse (exonuclease V) beta subunit